MLLMLLTLSGWILHSGMFRTYTRKFNNIGEYMSIDSDATNCSVYLSSQPLILNLLCPSAICRLGLSNMRGCNSDCPCKYIISIYKLMSKIIITLFNTQPATSLTVIKYMIFVMFPHHKGHPAQGMLLKATSSPLLVHL